MIRVTKVARVSSQHLLFGNMNCVCVFCQNVGMAMVKSQDVKHTPPRNSCSLHGIKK